MVNGLEFVGGCVVGRVADAKFNVKGVDGLLVVDWFVIRDMPDSSLTLSMTVVMEEHAARVIAKDYRSTGTLKSFEKMNIHPEIGIFYKLLGFKICCWSIVFIAFIIFVNIYNIFYRVHTVLLYYVIHFCAHSLL